MLLTDQVRIQEVLLFPAMKPEDKGKDEKKEEVKEETKSGPKVEEPPKKEWLQVNNDIVNRVHKK